MVRRILLLGLLGALAEGAKVERPSEFYIVMDGYEQKPNYGVGNYQELLAVAPDGQDSIVRYVRLEHAFQTACGRGLIVKGIETKLRNVSAAELSAGANPCGVDRRTLTSAQERRGEGASLYEPQAMAIVTRCGLKQVRLRLIDPRIVKFGPVARFSPDPRDLWDLASHVIDRAFPNRTPWYGGSEADDREMQAVGARLLRELAAGQYDQGLRQACDPRSGSCQSRTFRELLEDYQGPRNLAQLAAIAVPRLIDADRYGFAKYINPIYPALTKSARIQGQVELRLGVDPASGDVMNVAVASGHPMLISSAVEAAKQWHFSPGWANSEPIKVVLDYAIRCPTNPPLIPTAVQ